MSVVEAPAEVKVITHLDLPETDGKPVENAFEHPQSMLLSDVMLPVLNRLHPDGNYFIGADTGIYWYHAKPDPLDGCKSPDWYYVPNVPERYEGKLRRSYVQFTEKVNPLVVIEYVSGNGDEERDTTPITGKFWVYEHGIAATFYIIWDEPRGNFEVYELIRGRYQRATPDENGRVRIGDMGIRFGVWHGRYHKYITNWLRVWDDNGVMLPTEAEQKEEMRRHAEQERQRAEAEKQRAEQERQRAETEKQRADAEAQRAEAEKQRADTEKQHAEKLAAKLRELGINPDSV